MQLFNYDGGSWGKKNPAEAEWGKIEPISKLLYTLIFYVLILLISLCYVSDMSIRMLN
jgi:hypothetical protein